MTNEEAIKYLIVPIATSTEPSAEYLKQKEAYELAIKVLGRPKSDLISRKALKEYFAYRTNVKFKMWCEPGDGWLYFSGKEIEEIIDKCPD